LYDKVNIKSVIIVTSLAAVISVAAGGIGGVSLGTLLIRALLFSLLFAVGTALVNIVVDTYLPELKAGQEVTMAEGGEEEGDRGRNVDIVMDDGEEAQDASSPNGSPAEGNIRPPEADSGAPSFISPGGSSEGAARPVEAVRTGSPGTELPDIGVFSSLTEEDEEDESIASIDATEAPSMGVTKARFAAMQTNDEDKKEFFQNNTTAEEMAKGVRTMLKSD
ncbi:MAG: hypothetical protein PQJ60_05140, partial [Spirochaetales bacterium]|nr:hypothetical protein [Spirochaetales bacterium]